MTLHPQLCASDERPLSPASAFYAAVNRATSLNSTADRERIHKLCGSHTRRKLQLPPPQLPPLPHHSKLADALCDERLPRSSV